MRRGLPVLLAPRFGQILRIVFCADDELDRRAAGAAGDVEGKRGVAALMRAEASTVNPDRRLVVDGTEMQQQPFAVGERRQLEREAVPASFQE